MFCSKSPDFPLPISYSATPSIIVSRATLCQIIVELRTDKKWSTEIRDMAIFFITKLSGWTDLKTLIIENEYGEIIGYSNKHSTLLNPKSQPASTRTIAHRIRFCQGCYSAFNAQIDNNLKDGNSFFRAVLGSMNSFERQRLMGENISECTEETQIGYVRHQLADYLSLNEEQGLLFLDQLRRDDIAPACAQTGSKAFENIINKVTQLFPELKNNDFSGDWLITLKKNTEMLKKFLTNILFTEKWLKDPASSNNDIIFVKELIYLYEADYVIFMQEINTHDNYLNEYSAWCEVAELISHTTDNHIDLLRTYFFNSRDRLDSADDIQKIDDSGFLVFGDEIIFLKNTIQQNGLSDAISDMFTYVRLALQYLPHQNEGIAWKATVFNLISLYEMLNPSAIATFPSFQTCFDKIETPSLALEDKSGLLAVQEKKRHAIKKFPFAKISGELAISNRAALFDSSAVAARGIENFRQTDCHAKLPDTEIRIPSKNIIVDFARAQGGFFSLPAVSAGGVWSADESLLKFQNIASAMKLLMGIPSDMEVPQFINQLLGSDQIFAYLEGKVYTPPDVVLIFLRAQGASATKLYADTANDFIEFIFSISGWPLIWDETELLEMIEMFNRRPLLQADMTEGLVARIKVKIKIHGVPSERFAKIVAAYYFSFPYLYENGRKYLIGATNFYVAWQALSDANFLQERGYYSENIADVQLARALEENSSRDVKSPYYQHFYMRLIINAFRLATMETRASPYEAIKNFNINSNKLKRNMIDCVRARDNLVRISEEITPKATTELNERDYGAYAKGRALAISNSIEELIELTFKKICDNLRMYKSKLTYINIFKISASFNKKVTHFHLNNNFIFDLNYIPGGIAEFNDYFFYITPAGGEIYLGRSQEECVEALMTLGSKAMGFNITEHVFRSTGLRFDESDVDLKVVLVGVSKSDVAPIIQRAAQSITQAILFNKERQDVWQKLLAKETGGEYAWRFSKEVILGFVPIHGCSVVMKESAAVPVVIINCGADIVFVMVVGYQMFAVLKGAQTTLAHESQVTVVIQEILSGASSTISDMVSSASSTFNILYDGESHGWLSQAPGRSSALGKSLSAQEFKNVLYVQTTRQSVGPETFFGTSKLSTWKSINNIPEAFLKLEMPSPLAGITTSEQELLGSIQISATVTANPAETNSNVAMKRMNVRVVTRKAGLSRYGAGSRSLRVLGKKPNVEAFPPGDIETLRVAEAERLRHMSLIADVARNAAKKIADAMVPGLGNVVSRTTSVGTTVTQPKPIGPALVMGLVSTTAISALSFLGSEAYIDWSDPDVLVFDANFQVALKDDELRIKMNPIDLESGTWAIDPVSFTLPTAVVESVRKDFVAAVISPNVKQDQRAPATTARITILDNLPTLSTVPFPLDVVTRNAKSHHIFPTERSIKTLFKTEIASTFTFPTEIAKVKIQSSWRVDNRDYCQIERSKEVLIRARLSTHENAMFRAIDIDLVSRKILHLRVNHVTNSVVDPLQRWFVDDQNYARRFIDEAHGVSLPEENTDDEAERGEQYQRTRCVSEAWNDLRPWYDAENRFAAASGRYISTMTAHIANKIAVKVADEMLSRIRKEEVSRLGCEIATGLAAPADCTRGDIYIGRIDGAGVLHNLPPIAFCNQTNVRFRRFLSNALTLTKAAAMEEFEISDFPLLKQLQLDCSAQNMTVLNNPLLETIRGFAAAKKIVISGNSNLRNVTLTEKREEKRYHLNAIYLKQNPKMDFLEVGHFPELKSIYIDRGNLTDIQFNAKQHYLKYISVKNNRLKNLDCLAFLPELASLDFSHNALSGEVEIHDWHFNAAHLKRINLSHNGIGKLIIHAKGLTSLDASNNRLTGLDILGESPKNVVHFDVSNNQIKMPSSSYGPLMHDMQHLRFLDFSGNPIVAGFYSAPRQFPPNLTRLGVPDRHKLSSALAQACYEREVMVFDEEEILPRPALLLQSIGLGRS